MQCAVIFLKACSRTVFLLDKWKELSQQEHIK